MRNQALAGDHPCRLRLLEICLNVVVSIERGHQLGAGLNIFADLRLPCTDHTRAGACDRVAQILPCER